MSVKHLSRALDLFERTTVHGETNAQAGAAYGITQNRVQQLTSWTTRMLLNPKRLRGDKPPDHDWRSVAVRRQYADFWREQIDKARADLK